MSTPSDLPEYEAETPRVDVAEDMEEAMDEALRKFTDGRVRDAENERVRIRWLGAFVKVAAEYRKLVNDIEASEQEARIERLEELVEHLE